MEPRGQSVQATDPGKDSGKERLFSRHDHFLRHLNPRHWSLKGRFLYLTGALLLLGNIVLIVFFYFTQHSGVRQLASARLSILSVWLQSEVERQQTALAAQASALAAVPEVHQSMAEGDEARLRRVALPYLDRLRLATGIGSYQFQFRQADGRIFLLTETGEMSGHSPLLDSSGVPPSWGLAPGRFGLDILATVPVIDNQRHVGDLTALSALTETIRNLRLPSDHGVILLVRGEAAPNGAWTVAGRYGDMGLSPEQAILAADGRISRVGDRYLSFVALKGHQGRPLGGLILSHDAALQRQIMWSNISKFILFYSAGAVLVWVFLFINVVRIETFLARLKKILISSHANYFSERFASDHVHCLDILHCHNEECPAYQDRSLVCYLETGTEAVSPRWRGTCIYLNKYETCSNCPVYAMRKNDEVTELRNVVNTRMRLWGNFLTKVGRLLSQVLQHQERAGQAPSLDDISERLGQMAQLTFFSRDLQGVVDKEEVYQQLSHIFEKRYGLTRFVFFEVDHDNQRSLAALDTVPEEPLCKNAVLINSDVCRAKRMADEVTSFYNPKLCPHFHADLDKDVRCCLPIVMGGQVGVVFSFLVSRRDTERMRAQVPIIRKYLEEASPVLNSLRLLGITREQSLRDPLTLCHNRRFLDEYISKYEPLALRENKRTGFLMVDMDYFKQVNDKYGHQAGDAVLQQLAQILQASIRRSDLLIRYGGEEFLILLQNIQNGLSEQIAEKIRLAVEQNAFALPAGVSINKTVSIGVSEHPADANALYKAIKFADVALYEAKRRGRNKVVSFTPELWSDEEY